MEFRFLKFPLQYRVVAQCNAEGSSQGDDPANDQEEKNYNVVGVGSVLPTNADIVKGDTVSYTGKAAPYGVPWPPNNPTVDIIRVDGGDPVGAGEIIDVQTNQVGDVSFKFKSDPNFVGLVKIILKCGSSSMTANVNVVGEGEITGPK